MIKGLTRDQKNISQRNRKKAVKYFESIGALPLDRKPYEYALHHKDSTWAHNDVERYIQWNPEDLEVVKFSKHTSDHSKDRIGVLAGEKNGMYGVHRYGEANPMYGKRGELSPLYGRKHSEETKAKMSASAKARWASNATNRT